MMMLFKKKKKELPKLHWKDITISRNKAILDVYDRYEGQEKDLFFLYDLTCAAYGKPSDWIDGMKVGEANEYINSLAIVNEKPKVNIARGSYILNGHKYKVSMNMQAITTAQYIDFQQMADKAKDMPAEFLSIILVPNGHKYNDGYDMEEVTKDIENYMCIEDCLGLTAFFLRLWQMSMKRALRKLNRMVDKAEKEGLMSKEQLDALKRVRQLLESANGLKPLTL